MKSSKRGKQTKQTKPLFAKGQCVEKMEDAWAETVSILDRRWAGHVWYYKILKLDGTSSWVLESQLKAPLGAS